MIRYDRALKILRAAAAARGLLPVEKVPLEHAFGRVAADDITSPEPLPRFDNSAMDGYALSARLTRGASPARSLHLAVAGSIAAGDRPPKPLSGPAAYEIMTGAPVPPGCDAIVKVEDVEVQSGGRSILLTAPAGPGDYIRRAGQDFAAGMLICGAGTKIDARRILALAASGAARVPVRRKPRVALISTGRELVEPSRKPGPGQIRNATAAYLTAALAELGAEVRSYGTAADDPADFRRRVKKALAAEPDAVVTTGAVSMGRHDFVAGELRALGAEALYHKVSIRPGKPGLLARFKGGPLFFGLPGNPVSTVVGLRFFLAPFLRRLSGEPEERPWRARLAAGVAKPEGLRCFLKAALTASPDGLSARALPGQASFQIGSLLDADCWLVLPEEGAVVRAGTEVAVFPLMPGAPERRG